MIIVYCNHCGIDVKMYRARMHDIDDKRAYECRDSCGTIIYIQIVKSNINEKAKKEYNKRLAETPTITVEELAKILNKDPKTL